MKKSWRQKNKKIMRDEESMIHEKDNEVNIKGIRKLMKEKKRGRK